MSGRQQHSKSVELFNEFDTHFQHSDDIPPPPPEIDAIDALFAATTMKSTSNVIAQPPKSNHMDVFDFLSPATSKSVTTTSPTSSSASSVKSPSVAATSTSSTPISAPKPTNSSTSTNTTSGGMKLTLKSHAARDANNLFAQYQKKQGKAEYASAEPVITPPAPAPVKTSLFFMDSQPVAFSAKVTGGNHLAKPQPQPQPTSNANSLSSVLNAQQSQSQLNANSQPQTSAQSQGASQKVVASSQNTTSSSSTSTPASNGTNAEPTPTTDLENLNFEDFFDEEYASDDPDEDPISDEEDEHFDEEGEKKSGKSIHSLFGFLKKDPKDGKDAKDKDREERPRFHTNTKRQTAGKYQYQTPTNDLRSGGRVPLSYVAHQVRLRAGETAREAVPLNIVTGSWNVNGKKPNREDDLREWISPSSILCPTDSRQVGEDISSVKRVSNPPPDVVVIGFQEIVALSAKNLIIDPNANGKWERIVEAALFDSIEKYRLSGSPAPPETHPLHINNISDNISSAEIPESKKGGYVLVASEHLVGLALSVWVRGWVKPHLSVVTTGRVGVGIMGVGGNKGAVGVSMVICDTSLCFLNAHIAAHQNNVKHRNEHYFTILRRLRFEPSKTSSKGITGPVLTHPVDDSVGSLTAAGGSSSSGNSTLNKDDLNPRDLIKPLSAFYGGDDFSPFESYAPNSGAAAGTEIKTPMEHDHVIWLGDLNYRLAHTNIAQAFNQIEQNDIASLLSFDQLCNEKNGGRAFSCFQELPITFRPTYKYTPGTNLYERRPNKKIRMPSWCDRIQFFSTVPNTLQSSNYSRCEYTLSDHKPVRMLSHMVAFRQSPSAQLALARHLSSLTVNEVTPKVLFSWQQLHISSLRFRQQIRHSLKMKNTGHCVVRFSITSIAPSADSAPGLTVDEISHRSQICSQRGVAPLYCEDALAVSSGLTTKVFETSDTVASSRQLRLGVRSPNNPFVSSWLKVSPSSGVLLPGQMIEVSVVVEVPNGTIGQQLSSSEKLLDGLLAIRIQDAVIRRYAEQRGPPMLYPDELPRIAHHEASFIRERGYSTVPTSAPTTKTHPSLFSQSIAEGSDGEDDFPMARTNYDQVKAESETTKTSPATPISKPAVTSTKSHSDAVIPAILPSQKPRPQTQQYPMQTQNTSQSSIKRTTEDNFNADDLSMFEEMLGGKVNSGLAKSSERDRFSLSEMLEQGPPPSINVNSASSTPSTTPSTTPHITPSNSSSSSSSFDVVNETTRFWANQAKPVQYVLRVSGSYIPSCFGTSLRHLVGLAQPIRTSVFPSLNSLAKTPIKTSDLSNCQTVPKEIYFLLRAMVDFGAFTSASLVPTNFAEFATLPSVSHIREVIDSCPHVLNEAVARFKIPLPVLLHVLLDLLSGLSSPILDPRYVVELPSTHVMNGLSTTQASASSMGGSSSAFNSLDSMGTLPQQNSFGTSSSQESSSMVPTQAYGTSSGGFIEGSGVGTGDASYTQQTLATWCKYYLRELPSPTYNLFVYLFSFFRALIDSSRSSITKCTAQQLTMLLVKPFTHITHIERPFNEQQPKTPVHIIYHILRSNTIPSDSTAVPRSSPLEIA